MKSKVMQATEYTSILRAHPKGTTHVPVAGKLWRLLRANSQVCICIVPVQDCGWVSSTHIFQQIFKLSNFVSNVLLQSLNNQSEQKQNKGKFVRTTDVFYCHCSIIISATYSFSFEEQLDLLNTSYAVDTCTPHLGNLKIRISHLLNWHYWIPPVERLDCKIWFLKHI